ncbi:MAG TPA: histidine phosphatase family protein [Propionibacteriaceae bacterium]|nr:histidine phosphatase family protein [Propionibacteriaceae bacterium]
MAERLLAVAYAPTAETRTPMFGGWSSVVGDVPALDGPVASWVRGPETVGAETAERLGGAGAEVLPELADAEFGAWADLTLDEVAEREPQALRVWLIDPWVSPHGGESFADLIWRVGQAVDGHAWPEGRSVAVVPPLVARALAVHALGAPPEVIFRVEVGPLGRVLMSRSGDHWRLQGLA